MHRSYDFAAVHALLLSFYYNLSAVDNIYTPFQIVSYLVVFAFSHDASLQVVCLNVPVGVLAVAVIYLGDARRGGVKVDEPAFV